MLKQHSRNRVSFILKKVSHFNRKQRPKGRRYPFISDQKILSGYCKALIGVSGTTGAVNFTDKAQFSVIAEVRLDVFK